MADSLAAVVLAAGLGRRLRPLSLLRPKALCPVANVPLVDLALARVQRATGSVAVNVHAGRPQMEPHLTGRVHLSLEGDELLGTAGALGRLRPWVDGRAVLIANADAWLPEALDVPGFVAGWDGVRTRLLCVHDDERGDWDDLRYCGLGLLPWREIAALPDAPAGLWQVSWRHLRPGHDLELVVHPGPFWDCGTPSGYLAANLTASAGASVVAPDGRVDGHLDRAVVWPGARVWPGEQLSCAIRADDVVTVLVR